MKRTAAGIVMTAALLAPAPAPAQSSVEVTKFVRDPVLAADAQGNSVSLSSSDVTFPLRAEDVGGDLWVEAKGRRLSLPRRHIVVKEPPQGPCSRLPNGGSSVTAGVAGAGPNGCPVEMRATK